MQIFVLLVNANTANEGIHSINIGERDIILMFEEEDDALRYALLLEAQDFPAEISVEGIEQQEIEDFCESAGYSYYFIAKDFRPSNDFERMLLVPPERNRENPDWEIDGSETTTSQDEAEAGEMSNDELDSIRNRLEGLL
ncbi:DUF3110 domain-containing protein [filamentous cyanobacterium LEGE 11480]|uniref:DUF3110 domain-containing protein n=1 Tax=Romeriopsis navalis LEGE 11480 TaxID=2777977 RepID=A0A928VNL9_9CYAN|nr:DUF3110 domain-containing protein [Romeriopsis navalis]MBE9029707.1 DUF3110 domain-containing protein [Romeriopsis navalis LEGE 11480]